MVSFLDWGIVIYPLAALGVAVIFWFLLDIIWTAIQALHAFLAPYMLNEDPSTLKKYGEWALITGCTDGIGKQYAFELAKRGHSLILVSRSKDKLEATSKEIGKKEYAVKTKIITADFSKGAEAINHIRSEVGVIPVSILVNNVGSQYSYPMYVGEVPEEQLWDIINVNIGAITLLTRLFIGEMRTRGKGAIVNVSSGSELQPLPLMTVYAASKAYIKSFTEALRYEYGSNVTIQHLTPFFINTKMNQFSKRLRRTSIFVPNAKGYAKYAASTLGKLNHSTGYWSHGIQYFFMTMAPTWIRMWIGGSLNKSFRDEYFANLQNNS